MSAEALRRRLAHGNVYAPDKVDAALSNYFREGNLTALRETRPALGGRQGRRRAPGLPPPSRHHRHLGGPRAGARRADRRARG
nr:hypothetical protein [Nocardioides convexus]